MLSNLTKLLENEATRDGVTKHVGGAVPVIDGGILIIKRASHETFLPDYWEIPSGGREKSDDTIFSTVERELREETGLEITSIVSYLGFFDYSTKTNHKVRQWNFLVSVFDNQVKLCPTEHDAYRIIKGIAEIDSGLLISVESKNVIMQSLRLLQEGKI